MTGLVEWPLGDSEETDSEQLIARHIEQNPSRPGPGNARVVSYGVPVWALVAHLDAVDGSVDRVADDYELPREVVLAALNYYRRHKDAIDARIAANAA
ncbi:MAG: DUF433 domain-containing protein [Chloroflexi bacterium]|nr:DUF433 domain-containing protein [Chloroflexota bacterium]